MRPPPRSPAPLDAETVPDDRSPQLTPNFEQAKSALEAATHVDEVSGIHDQSEAAQIHLAQPKTSLAIQNQRANLKPRAERRLGELLGKLRT